MPKNVFTKAVQELSSNINYSQPELFKSYLSRNGLNSVSINTAQYLSIQSFSDLNPELKKNNLMIFRLGSRQKTKGTYFALAKVLNDWNDYFLFDQTIFNPLTKKIKHIDWNSEPFISFTIIPKLTETSFVNLALSTGVLEEALNLDSNSVSIPATGRGNYTFNVKPSSKLNADWLHYSGQVEIDSIFSGTRNGVEHLFIIEAKSGKFPDSLAKHKLMYPVLSVINQIPQNIKITPVYLRVDDNTKNIDFYIAECKSFSKNDDLYIDSILVERTISYTVPKTP
ncbi:MAG TPA: hypothetical protein ENK73_03845 [Thiomicrospira sp.]|nr:hypothetical protein [Thiomicrospira sp.]